VLIVIAKRRLHLPNSLHELPQILSLTMFETTLINQLLSRTRKIHFQPTTQFMELELIDFTEKIPRNLRSKSVKPAASNSRKKRPSPFFDDHPQQPADVVARRAQHRVQTVAFCAFEVVY
jgi:hypothetical protein